MKTTPLSAAAALGMVFAALAAEPIVARTGFDQPKEWARKPFCGKDFFPLLSDNYWAAFGAKDAPESCSVYRECGWRVIGRELPGVNHLVSAKGSWSGKGDGYARLLPEEKWRKTPYTLRDFLNSGNGGNTKKGDKFYSAEELDRPVLLSLGGMRPAFLQNDEYPLADRADFAKWKASHPNYLGYYTMGEFDSDTDYYWINQPRNRDAAAWRILQDAFPCSFYDYAWNTALFDTYAVRALKRAQAYCFGDTTSWAMSSGSPSLLQIFAHAGLSGLCYEASTQQMDANWRISGAFLRGAARQWRLPYGWYTANFYDGFKRGDGPEAKKTCGENSFGPVHGYGFFGLNRGASFQLIHRQNVYGWLIGAQYVEPENWYHYHMQPVKGASDIDDNGGKMPPGKTHVPSKAALDFQELYALSKRVDRGYVYAPLALCFPLHQRVTNCGAQLNFTGYEISAALMTIAPSGLEPEFRRRGVEGGFMNAEFGDMWDVVVPDAYPDDAERTLASLRPYKAAALIGRYRPGQLATPALTRYAEEGGTLFISENYVEDGVVEAAAAGVTFDGRKMKMGGEWLVDENGRRTALEGPYVFKTGAPTTAKPLWTDENGTVIAYVNRVGRGKVVTITAPSMLTVGLDRAWGIPDSTRYHRDFKKIYSGEWKFTVLREIFRRVQAETMPFQVAGDIHWGVNKIEVKGKGEGEQRMVVFSSDGALGERALPDDGRGRSPSGPQSNNQTIKQSNNSPRRWLVWLFNNKGITNFVGEAPIVDHGADAKVTVTGALGVKIASVRSIRMNADAQDKSNNLQISKSNNSFTVAVPAGDWVACEVVEE